MSYNTYGEIKKRILDTLGEYTDKSSFVNVYDTDQDMLFSRIPDALNSSLTRMYESLEIGLSRGVFLTFGKKPIVYRKMISDDTIEFETDITNAAIVFYYCGRGSIEIVNENGLVQAELVCEGDGRVARKAESITLSGKRFTVKKYGFAVIGEFCVFDMSQNPEIDAYAPFGKMSVLLPDDFSSFDRIFSGGRRLDDSLIERCGAYAYFEENDVRGMQRIDISYRVKPPVITSDTSDDFVFTLPQIAVEALICLSAAELCREGDNTRYTRLMYKYSDLSEGLRCRSGRGRNGFFSSFKKMGWI